MLRLAVGFGGDVLSSSSLTKEKSKKAKKLLPPIGASPGELRLWRKMNGLMDDKQKQADIKEHKKAMTRHRTGLYRKSSSVGSSPVRRRKSRCSSKENIRGGSNSDRERKSSRASFKKMQKQRDSIRKSSSRRAKEIVPGLPLAGNKGSARLSGRKPLTLRIDNIASSGRSSPEGSSIRNHVLHDDGE